LVEKQNKGKEAEEREAVAGCVEKGVSERWCLSVLVVSEVGHAGDTILCHPDATTNEERKKDR